MKIFLAYVVFTASSKYSSGDMQESLRSAWSTYESAMIAAKEGAEEMNEDQSDIHASPRVETTIFTAR